MHRIESTNEDVSSGVNLFTNGPPGTTVNAEIMNAIQEEIANVIEQAGLVLLTKGTDTRNQLWDALQILGRPYDYIVASQANLNDAIERVAANQYKIKDDYTSIFVKQLAGGYNASGPQSFLSGGDTWGYIQTNNCQHIEFEAGAYLNFGVQRGYLDINTDNAYLKNVDIRGDKTSAAATVRSYYINADGVTMEYCKSSARLSNTNIKVFEMNVAKNEETSRFIGCVVEDIDTDDDLDGFNGCWNLSNCLVKNVESTTGPDDISGFRDCVNLNNCVAKQIDGADTLGGEYTSGFRNCKELTSCRAEDIDLAAGSGFCVGFFSCNQLTSCKAIDIAFNGGTGQANGFNSCNQLSGCIADQIDGSTNNPARAFLGCNRLSACYADDVDTVNSNAEGFSSCNYLSACTANDIDSSGGNAYGFNTCQYGSSLYTAEAVNPGCNFIDTADAGAVIATDFSCNDNWT